MVKYLKAECYKAFQRKYIYIFSGICLAFVALFMFLLRVESRSVVDDMITMRVHVDDLVAILVRGLSVGLYLLMIAADIVFSEQYKNNTLKNEVSYGLPRLRIYLGKLTASFLVAIVLCTVLIGSYLGISYIFFPAGADVGDSLRMLGLCMLVSLPLWMGGLGFFHMLQFIIRGSTAATVIYVMLLGVGSGFLDLMSIFLPVMTYVADLVRTVSLTTPFELMLQQGPELTMGYAWMLGMAWLGLSTLLGAISFRKKEIS